MGTLQKFSKFTHTYNDDKIISALKEPIRFAFILVGAHLFFLLIFKETELIKNILNTLVVYTIFWAIIAVLESLRDLFHHATEKFNPDLAKEMELLLARGIGACCFAWRVEPGPPGGVCHADGKSYAAVGD